jgi:hypothetical protein
MRTPMLAALCLLAAAAGALVIALPVEAQPGDGTGEGTTVGFRGDPATLAPIGRDTDLPPGTRWEDGALVVERRNLRLEDVYVRGGVRFDRRGSLSIRDSIVEGGYGATHVVLGTAKGATLDVRRSTLRWRPDREPGVDTSAAIQISNLVRIVAIENDISGTTDGIQVAGDRTRIVGNRIHDLALVGTFPESSHNDGIQVFAGRDVLIRDNHIEIGFDDVHQNAAVFLQPGDGDSITAPRIVRNVLEGGRFTLRLEQPTTTDAVVVDNRFHRSTANQADAYALMGATIAAWEGNVDEAGQPVPRP